MQKVKFRARGRKASLQECFELCLNQRRHEEAGNKIAGYTFEEILAMTAAERERVKQAGWPSKQNSGG